MLQHLGAVGMALAVGIVVWGIIELIVVNKSTPNSSTKKDEKRMNQIKFTAIIALGVVMFLGGGFVRFVKRY